MKKPLSSSPLRQEEIPQLNRLSWTKRPRLQKAELMPQAVSQPHLEEDACIHIFSVSAGLVGVCTTVLGLIRLAMTLGKFETIADDLLAADALVFLLACLFSYWALRTRRRRMHRAERIADCLFLVGLALMVTVCVLFTYAMASPGLAQRP